MRHDEAFELLAPLALDAVDEAERRDLEAHVAGCARCQLELAELAGVAGAVGNVVEAPPERVWAAIADRLYGTADPPALAPPRAPRRAGRWPRGTAWLAVAAAVAAIVVLSVLLAGANHGEGGLGGASSALATPGHRVEVLDSAHHRAVVRLVTVPGGRTYLVDSTLVALPATETYQLWEVTDGHAVSLGLLGPDPHEVVTMVPPARATSTLAITVEPAGGAAAPTAAPVASGTL